MLLRLLELLSFGLFIIILVSQILVPMWDDTPIFPSLRRTPKREEEEEPPNKQNPERFIKPTNKPR